MNLFRKIFFFLTVPVFIFCQTKYHVDEVICPEGFIKDGNTYLIPNSDNLLYVKKTNKLVNGIVYWRYGDLGLYKNGKKEGMHKSWVGRNNFYRSDWVNRSKHHLFEEYFENGEYAEGVYKTYYLDGTLKSSTEITPCTEKDVKEYSYIYGSCAPGPTRPKVGSLYSKGRTKIYDNNGNLRKIIKHTVKFEDEPIEEVIWFNKYEDRTRKSSEKIEMNDIWFWNFSHENWKKYIDIKFY